VGCCGPCEGAAFLVVVVDEVVDFGNKVFDVPEAAATDRLWGDETEPSLNLVEPGRVGGCVVNLEAGPFGEPEAHLGMLMRGIVVDDQMDGQVFWHSLIDALEKAQKLLMPVAWLAFGKDRAGSNVEGGE